MVAAGVHELALVGGHTGLDLVNTVEPRLDGVDRHEHLDTPEALLTWARRAELLTAAEARSVAAAWSGAPSAATAALRAAVDVRESLYRALHELVDPGADGRDHGEALGRLTRRWADAAGRSRLVPDDRRGAGARMQVGTDPALLVPDRLAGSAVELLSSVDLSHLHACPEREGGCGRLFLDHSRNGSRRWCSMADCGARAKARRLTERRRARRAGSGAG